MKTSRTDRLLIGAAALALAAGLPALGQDAPESLLPPGFNDPVSPPPPTPGATPRPQPTRPGGEIVQPIPAGSPTPTPTPTPTGTPTPVDPEALRRYELPEFARRSTAVIGIAGADVPSYGRAGFGAASGGWLHGLMRRLDAPVASRWVSIALRRALVADLTTPPGVQGADFAAERAWLLIRMGEANAARAVVQAVDVENYTPKLFQVAMQAMLATADPAGLCPLVEPATRVSNERGWRYAAAMCAGLRGEPAQATPLLAAARRGHDARGIDSLLAEKVLGAGAQGRRAVTIEWNAVDTLSAWRYGLATATGVEVPQALYATVGPQVRLWNATAPGVAPWSRLGDADLAAAQGVFSSEALVDLYAQASEAEETTSAQSAIAADLRSAFTAGSQDERIAALRRIWGGAGSERLTHARHVLTARAAAGIAPNAARVDDAAAVVASMLAAGLDIPATRWRSTVPVGSDAWAMLAVGSPRARLIDDGAVSDYAGTNTRKGQLLLAGLAGLGRIAPDDVAGLARDLNVAIGAQNAWTRAIDRAGAAREGATVLLLAAIGMQTASWQGVPPEILFHVVAALRAAGLEGEARMIAAEAIARA